jgi:hypothetical protein
MRVALFFSLTAIPVVVKISGDSNYRGDGGETNWYDGRTRRIGPGQPRQLSKLKNSKVG